MDEKRKEKIGKEVNKSKEVIQSKSLKTAHSIISEIESITKKRLSFETFDMVYKKVQEAAMDGFIEGLFVAYKSLEGQF